VEAPGGGLEVPPPGFSKGTMADKDESMSEVEATEEEQETALLPRSFFQGKDIEVGKKCEIKVEGIFDDEIEVSYVKSKKKGKDGKDSDDDKPRRDRDSDTMRDSLREFDAIAPMSGPPPMGAY
jgi:hypothetical protein